jgi:hypothetical protein
VQGTETFWNDADESEAILPVQAASPSVAMSAYRASAVPTGLPAHSSTQTAQTRVRKKSNADVRPIAYVRALLVARVARHPPFGLPDTHRLARGTLIAANHSEYGCLETWVSGNPVSWYAVQERDGNCSRRRPQPQGARANCMKSALVDWRHQPCDHGSVDQRHRARNDAAFLI